MPATCQRCGMELPPGVSSCPVCDGPVPPPRSSAAQAEMRWVTVLSADFQGFTAFTATSDAEDVRDFITTCWKQIAPLIASHGGKVEKYIGDAVVALFGAEQAREDDPTRAVQAALDIQTRLRQIEAVGNEPLLPLRIGVHTGRIIVEPQTAGLSAFGDAICVADRLQKKAPLGSVLISHDTYRHVRDRFLVLPPRLENIEGRKDPLRTYVVAGLQPRPRIRVESGVEGVETAMVGRDAELHLLQSELRTAMETRQPRMVTILGEPGMGKSRLIGEFFRWVENSPVAVRFFTAWSYAETAGSPFGVLRDLLTARFDIRDSDSAAVAKEKLESGVAGLLAGYLADAVEWPPERTAHFLGHLAGMDFSASPHLQSAATDPEQFRARAFQAAVRLLTAASRGPVEGLPAGYRTGGLAVFENAHWSDDASLDLIAHLGKSSPGAPMLMVCLSRPELLERRPAWGADLPNHQFLRLAPLAGLASRAFVQTILSRAPRIPDALLERVTGDAGGNPFYIEEIIKMLIEQSVIQPGAEWKIELTASSGAAVPSTLAGVLQARLDALLPGERALAQRASVLGRVFWDAALAELEAPDSPPIAESLAGLCRKQIIRREKSSWLAGAAEYSFCHDLLRNVAYEGMLKKSRQRLHERAALWLIRQSGERVNESASMVAGHFEKAGRAADAADWNGRAGQQAAASHLPAAAAVFFRKALEQSAPPAASVHPLPAKCLAWFDGLAESLTAQAQFAEAREAYQRMRDLAAAHQDLVADARACNGLAFLLERQANNHASIEAANEAIALSERAGAAGRGEKARALYFKGWAYYRLASAEQVLGLAVQCEILCRELGNQAGLARAFKLYGVAHLQLGQFDKADRYFQEGLQVAQQTGDLVTTAAMWSNRSETARARGDYQSAARLCQTALDITREIGWRDSERIYLCNLSAARIALGQFARAEADLREVIAQADPAGAWNLPEALGLLSEACLEQGKFGEALEAGQRASELARASGNSLLTAEAWRALGRAVAAAPEGAARNRAVHLTGGPEQCFQESLATYRQIRARGEEARTLRVWAESDLRRQRTIGVREKLEQAGRIFRELSASAEVEKVNTLLGRL